MVADEINRLRRRVRHRVEREHNLLYIQIPKVASTSIKIWLNHKEQTVKFEDAEFSNFFVFTVVRNPFDRILSTYRQLNEIVTTNRDTFPYPLDTFETFVRSLPEVSTQLDSHVATQASLIRFPDRKETDISHIDYVGRFEQIEESIQYVADRCGIKDRGPLPKRNQSADTDRPTVSHTEETKRITREVYKVDFDLFNYDLEL